MDTEKRHTGACKPEVGRGCAFCNCGSEPEAKLCDGCFKLHETAWLDEYPVNMPSDIVEVRFKNTRRSFYQNVNNLDLKRGDIVAVEASPGHDIGVVSLTGDLVARQMRRTGFNPYNGEYKKIYRKAKPYDIEKWQEAIALEHETMIASRQIAADMGLNMKIGDVEYQGDKIKAIFYYIADERVDFRELIKVFPPGGRTHRRTGRLRPRTVLRVVDVELFERHDRSRARAGHFAQPPEAGRAVLEAQVLHDVRIRHLCRRPQGVPAPARTAPGRRRRMVLRQERRAGRNDDLLFVEGRDGQRHHAARFARAGDHGAEPPGQEGRTVAGRRRHPPGDRGADLPFGGGQHHPLRPGQTPQAPASRVKDSPAVPTGSRAATTVRATEATQGSVRTAATAATASVRTTATAAATITEAKTTAARTTAANPVKTTEAAARAETAAATTATAAAETETTAETPRPAITATEAAAKAAITAERIKTNSAVKRSAGHIAAVAAALLAGSCVSPHQSAVTDVNPARWDSRAEIRLPNADTVSLRDAVIFLRCNDRFAEDTLTVRIATVTPDSLRFGEWFLLVIPHPKGPAALMCEAAIPYRRRIRLTQHGDYRCSVTPVRPVRGVEAVGVDLQQSR